jgi:hypothetical protein
MSANWSRQTRFRSRTTRTPRQARIRQRLRLPRGYGVLSVRRHPKGDTASRGTPRKPGRSSRPPGAIDERVELGVNEGRRARREVTFLRWVVSGALIYSAAAIVLPNVASAREYRSREVTREFQREHPCPSTGRTSGACPGYRKDHVKALACGGRDAVWNLQWQTVAEARAKDRWERKTCGR